MPLSDLIAALAAAPGPSRELDVMLAGLVFYRDGGTDEPWSAADIAYALGGERTCQPPAYTSSLDAITGAIKARWPNYRINASWAADYAGAELFATRPHFGTAASAVLPLCLCLAAARLAEAEAADAR